MQQYLDDDLDIDNNLAERVIQIVAIGCRNWFFAGSDAGAERTAIIYSLIASCKLCEISSLVGDYLLMAILSYDASFGRLMNSPTERT